MGSGDYLQANLLRQQMAAGADTYAQKQADNSNTQIINKAQELMASAKERIASGKELTKEQIAAIGTYGNAKTKPTLQKYEVGNAVVPSAISYGSASQMGTINDNSTSTYSIVINGTGLDAEQLSTLFDKKIADINKKANMSGAKSKVGK